MKYTIQSLSATPEVVVETKPVVLQAFKLYVNTPIDFNQVLLTVASTLWSPLVARDIANCLQNNQKSSAILPHQHPPLKRSLHHGFDMPLAKRPRPDFGAFQQDSDRFRPNFLTDEAKFAIGRVGEEYVYELLRLEYPPKVVEWVNADEETGLPYDICIHHPTGGTEFIEVKSTSTYDKVIFEMSVQELEYATQKGSQYSIYRAFAIKPHGALPDSRVVRLRNPITLLRHKKLQLSVLMTDEVFKM
jgi:hypothetical protein